MRRRGISEPVDIAQLEETFSSLVGKATARGEQALTSLKEMVAVLPFDLDNLERMVEDGASLDFGTNGPEMWEELERYAKEVARLCRETAALNKLVEAAHKELAIFERRNQWREGGFRKKADAALVRLPVYKELGMLVNQVTTLYSQVVRTNALSATTWNPLKARLVQVLGQVRSQDLEMVPRMSTSLTSIEETIDYVDACLGSPECNVVYSLYEILFGLRALRNWMKNYAPSTTPIVPTPEIDDSDYPPEIFTVGFNFSENNFRDDVELDNAIELAQRALVPVFKQLGLRNYQFGSEGEYEMVYMFANVPIPPSQDFKKLGKQLEKLAKGIGKRYGAEGVEVLVDGNLLKDLD